MHGGAVPQFNGEAGLPSWTPEHASDELLRAALAKHTSPPTTPPPGCAPDAIKLFVGVILFTVLPPY
jgi:hypothetical protein